MKFLVLILVLAVAYFLWRNARLADKSRPPPPAAGPGAAEGPQAMISCTACAMHLPRSEAVVGADGHLYCSQEHRLASEKQQEGR